MASSQTKSTKRYIGGASALTTNDGAVVGKKARTDNASPAPTAITNGFAMADFISPTVAQYLGVRSLVRFATTCSSHADILDSEVERRKKSIADIEVKVQELMGSQPESEPTRANVIAAKELVGHAKRLIDDEINFHHKIGIKELRLDGADDISGGEYDYDWRQHDFFLRERKKFLAIPLLGSLHIFPDCFYFPPEGECEQCLCGDEVVDASRIAELLCRGEHRMQSVYEREMGEDFNRLSYEQPFKKYDLCKLVTPATQRMHALAQRIVYNGSLDAFRVAARKMLYHSPTSRDCLWYTLEKADGIASCSDDSDNEEGDYSWRGVGAIDF